MDQIRKKMFVFKFLDELKSVFRILIAYLIRSTGTFEIENV